MHHAEVPNKRASHGGHQASPPIHDVKYGYYEKNWPRNLRFLITWVYIEPALTIRQQLNIRKSCKFRECPFSQTVFFHVTFLVSTLGQKLGVTWHRNWNQWICNTKLFQLSLLHVGSKAWKNHWQRIPSFFNIWIWSIPDKISPVS